MSSVDSDIASPAISETLAKTSETIVAAAVAGRTMRAIRGSTVAILGLLTLAACTVFSPSPAPEIYIVFFNAESTALSPDAKGVVALAAATIKNTHPAIVIVAGEPKTVVAPGFNPNLADPRFAAVEQALVADGVDSKLLARAPLTDIEARVGPAGNRRVEIRLFKNR